MENLFNINSTSNYAEQQKKLADDLTAKTLSSRKEITNNRAAEWYAVSSWLYGNANNIYYNTSQMTEGMTNDPREYAARKIFVDSVRKDLPGFSEDYLNRNYNFIR